ncbi:MEKHLA domain-containing protein [Croceicoccus gelatinilyticus]|uniref:MEKHLA domain-containing protein n=1 Tax=Croceicoccus gelatinilyticus TaxID=2835536 RepID=UPI001BCD4642|nr:MEKHLA domain-containing protein [Croceicoccus gelatinilyticus]MBS7669169.1 MEKHLA domain-containing protein [Croceicoccus gelatinilyticus]
MDRNFDRDADRRVIEASAGLPRIALIASSHLRVTGKPLVPEDTDFAHALWHLPAVVLAHGTEDDPLFFYANRTALDLFALTGEQLLAMPSRLSAEMPDRGERETLLAQVRDRGFIDDYAGVRIASTGQRFRIEAATVWNLIDRDGAKQGQAATFAKWQDL